MVVTMLSSDYQYIFLDFETTGLSFLRDDVIQVGLIVCNAKLEIQSYFRSYINPWYEVDKLKTIVSYTTWISPEQIMSGMSMEHFKEKMISIIPKNSIFVWHNIWFDLKFLKKYIKIEELQLNDWDLIAIDTLDRAKTLIHYPASYSLDILYPLVREQLGEHYFTNRSQECGLPDIQNHDALSDCIIGIGLMEYSIKKVQGLCETYPLLSSILKKSTLPYLQKNNEPQGVKNEDLPMLSFPVKSSDSTQFVSDTSRSNYSSGSKLYYGNIPIEQLIRKLSSAGKYILATNSKQKLMIVKSKMQLMGLKNVSFVKEQQYIDIQKLGHIADKSSLQDWETLFFIKYYSHHLQGLGLLDLNSSGDYKVYNYIRYESHVDKQNIVLATHHALFSVLTEKQYADYSIIFLDYEWRYASYLKYSSAPYDPINFPRVIDNYAYQYELDNTSYMIEPINQLLSLLDMFCGVLFMEIQNMVSNRQTDEQGKFEIGVIEDNSNFEKTNILLKKIQTQMNEFKRVVDEGPQNWSLQEDRIVIEAQYAKLVHYMKNISYVTPMISDYTHYSFTLWNSFVDYSEFLELLKWYKHYFLSNRNQTFTLLDKSSDYLTDTAAVAKYRRIDFESPEKLLIESDYKKVFILNNNPHKAKKLFEQLMEGWKYKDYSILVENVTWGRGKNLALAKTKTSYILVWGYEMFLQCITDKLKPELIITCSQLGLLHQQIVTDLQYRLR